MRHYAALVATLVAVSIVALSTLASGAAASPPQSGAMICDGSTGCYIIPEGLGAWLADCSTPDFGTGPFRCVTTVTAPFSATQTIVETKVLCEVYAGFPGTLIYQSTKGTIIVRQTGTTVSFMAICPRESAG